MINIRIEAFKGPGGFEGRERKGRVVSGLSVYCRMLVVRPLEGLATL